MSDHSRETTESFLLGGGETGAMLRSLGARMPLGPPQGWPQPLKTLVGVMLGSNQPMFVAWGPERTLIYNDPYGVILANKHPGAMGHDFLEVWSEIRDDLLPLVGRAYGGEPVHMDDIALALNRRGYTEEAHFSFSYTPVRDEAGAVAGFFCACVETTGHVRAASLVREREAQLRLIVDGARDYAIMTTDPERRVTSWSAGAEEAFGWTAAEAMGRSTDELFTPEDLAAGAPAQEALTAIAAGSAPDVRWHRAVDGSRVFMNGSVHPLPRDERGRERGFLKIARDETEQRRQADELARTRSDLVVSEARLRALIEALASAVWTTDPAGRSVEDSPTWRAFTGQSVDEWLGDGWLDAVHRDDRERAAQAWREAVASGQPLDIEFRLRHAPTDGWRWTRVRGVRLLDADGATASWVGMNVDIDDQKQAEKALTESEARFRNMADHAPVMMWVTDETGYCTYLNRAWYEFTGQSVDEATGYGWLDATHPDDKAEAKRLFVEANATRAPFRAEYRLRRADGSFRWTIDAAGPRFGEDGTYLGYIGSVIDITERREAEERTRELNDWLERRVEERTLELREAQDALRQSQKMEAIGQLTGGVAHDFNNLLTVIRSSADLLRRRELPEERRRRYVDAILETADRAAKLTSQLLAFARRQALTAEVFDAGERVRAIADMLRTVVGARVALELDVRCEPCHVDADAGQFETALINLAVNARDAMGGEGLLTIRLIEATSLPPVRGHVGAKGRFIAVSVADTGSGIAPDTLGRIFEPFFTTKEVGRGTGLGLSQVYGFAKQSGGEIDVHSEIGRGTTFTLYLPHVQSPAARTESTRPAERIDGQGRVLVVEDNAQVGEFATHLLRDLGYEASLAGNAQEAWEMLESGPERFDIVFSDVVMPGTGGVELGRRIRERWPEMPVVLTSGYSHVLASDARHGFPLVHKPYSVEDLSRALRLAGGHRTGSAAH